MSWLSDWWEKIQRGAVSIVEPVEQVVEAAGRAVERGAETLTLEQPILRKITIAAGGREDLARVARVRMEEIVRHVKAGRWSVAEAERNARDYGRDDLLTTQEYAHYVRAIRAAKPKWVQPAWEAAPQLPQEERVLIDGAKQLAEKEKPLATQYKDIMEAEIPDDRKQMHLDSATVTAGLPLSSSPIASRGERAVLGAMAPLMAFDIPRQLTIEAVRTAHIGGLTWDRAREIIEGTLKGKQVVESAATRRGRELGKGAPPSARLAALGMGAIEDIITDLSTPFFFGLTRLPALGGRLGIAAMKRSGGRFAAAYPKLAKARGPLEEVFEAIMPKVDLDAFYKGYGVSRIRSMLRAGAEQKLKQAGLSRTQITAAVNEFSRFTQAGGRHQVRLFGRELLDRPILRREPMIRDIEEVLKVKGKQIMDDAMKIVERAVTKPGALAIEAKVIGVEARALKQRDTAQALADVLLAMSKEERTPAGIIKKARNLAQDVYSFMVPRGRVPSAMASPLESILGKHQALQGRLSQRMIAPFRGMKGYADRRQVAKLLGMHPRLIRTPEFAELVQSEIGEVFGFTARQRLEWLLQQTGEYSDDVMSKAIKGGGRRLAPPPSPADNWRLPEGTSWLASPPTKHPWQMSLDELYKSTPQIKYPAGEVLGVIKAEGDHIALSAGTTPLPTNIAAFWHEVGHNISWRGYPIADEELIEQAARLAKDLINAGEKSIQLSGGGIARAVDSASAGNIEEMMATAFQGVKRGILPDVSPWRQVGELMDGAVRIVHRRSIQDAAAQGWAVPARVLKKYPGITVTKATVPKVSLSELPAKAKDIWRAYEETVENFIYARKWLTQRDIELNDAGPGYLTYRPITVEMTRARRALPGSKQFFEYSAQYEHPVIREWLSAAGLENLPFAQLDPLNTSRAYAAGMARAEVIGDIGNFAKTYGVTGIDRSIANVLGWAPLTESADAAWVLGAAKYPKAVRGITEYLLPRPVATLLDRQMRPMPITMKTLRQIGSIPRMAVLDWMTFLNQNVPDQPVSALMMGLPEFKSWAPGYRLATRAYFNDLAELGRASAPRGLAERLRQGVGVSGIGLHDVVDEKLFTQMRGNVMLKHMGGLLEGMDVDDKLARQILKELADSDVLHSGYAGFMARYEGNLGEFLDPIVRNTIGWGVRIGGAMEDLAKSSSYAALRVSGLSQPDAYRRLFTGFPHYSRAAQSQFDDIMRTVTYFWTYYKKRIPQLTQASMERPWLMWLPQKLRKSIIDFQFDEKEQILLEGRDKWMKYSQEYLPVTWDTWPFSAYKHLIPEDRRGEWLPHWTPLRAPIFGGTVTDAARLLGLTTGAGPDPMRAFKESVHPYARAIGYASSGDYRRAFRTAFPISGRAYELWEKGLLPERIGPITLPEAPKGPAAETGQLAQLYRKYDMELTKDVPERPTLTTDLWSLDRIALDIQAKTGFLVRFTGREGMEKGLPYSRLEDYNALLPPGEKVPFSSTHQAEVRKQYDNQRTMLGIRPGLGEEPPTLAEMNEAAGAGVRVDELIEQRIQRQQEATRIGMSYKDWLNVNKESEEYIPISETALRRANEKRKAAKLPLIDIGTAREMEGVSFPNTVFGVRKMIEGTVPWRSGYCQETVWHALYGRGGFGDADEGSAYLEKRGWEPMPVGAAVESGDYIYTEQYGGEHGHCGLAAKNPASGTLELLSNFGGDRSRTFMPLPDEYTIMRPPLETALELELQQLR